MNVIFCEDYRDNDDDELYLLFKGITPKQLVSALSILVPAGGQGVCKQMIMTEEECLYRNGLTPRQVAVQIIDRNEHFCSMPDFLLLVESRIRADYGCNIKKVNINTFVNS